MENKIINIEIPKGYEIDKEASTFSKIVFKPINTVKRWEDIGDINGYYIGACSTIKENISANTKNTFADKKILIDKNVFLTEKQAKSALALAQITQLLPYYRGYTDFKANKANQAICYDVLKKQFNIYCDFHFITGLFYFEDELSEEEYIKNNEDLLKQFFMID